METLRILFISLIFPILISTTSITNAEQTLISTYEDDLTGDGLKETIQLKGSLFSQESKYYRDIWVELTNNHLEKWEIPFGGGYEPEIHLFDFNHDGINDLFYQSATGGSGGTYSHHLYTFKNGIIEEIPLPQQLYIKGNFKEDFQIEIQIPAKNNNPPILINVEERANEYIRLNLYNKHGKLLKPTPVMVTPIALYKPILLSKSKGYGLKSFQKISGAYHADSIGTIEILWYFENGSWINLQTDWVPSL